MELDIENNGDRLTGFIEIRVSKTLWSLIPELANPWWSMKEEILLLDLLIQKIWQKEIKWTFGFPVCVHVLPFFFPYDLHFLHYSWDMNSALRQMNSKFFFKLLFSIFSKNKRYLNAPQDFNDSSELSTLVIFVLFWLEKFISTTIFCKCLFW